ncbi:glycosyltransferase [Plesiomonas sp. PI-19]|uniref:glycosyltransferase n=1 Tax=Plesiomonas sp. PI-19 TaxID=2898798 RepID=UPI001F31533F|nr:glycosyltransferase [Plesiomonas sp. PI-19]MCE5165510.1 glycosyltransferase [Plesiomonas sp. PI-19]
MSANHESRNNADPDFSNASKKGVAHLLLLDPIAFNGGSKVANRALLGLLKADASNRHAVKITVLTRDPSSWQSAAGNHLQNDSANADQNSPHWETVPLYELPGCRNAESGWRYFARHLFLALQVLVQRCRLGRRAILVGGSGPGVDLSLYLSAVSLGNVWPAATIVQLVHGPVAPSRTCARCLLRANYVFYVPGAAPSLQAALRRLAPADAPTAMIKSDRDDSIERPHWLALHNGLPAERWPSPVMAADVDAPALRLFWAASLLKWKGLDVLLAALESPQCVAAYTAHICFLRPKDTLLPVTDAPREVNRAPNAQASTVYWHEAPADLDAIRRRCSVFVSTSEREPFGLSVLEALAAGLCVLIPQDGAFWDQQLEHGVSCIKYRPMDAEDLALQLQTLALSPAQIPAIGLRGQSLAAAFRAEQTYAPVLALLQQAMANN